MRSSIENCSAYEESAISSDFKGRVESPTLDSKSCISFRFAFISVREKHVFRWVMGRPGTSAIAASEKVHSKVDSLGMAWAPKVRDCVDKGICPEGS